jgi:ribosomal protein S18 acetylase RimI-like enzyme
MTAPTVTLAAMSAETWHLWRAASIEGYAEDKVRIGAWPAEGAAARAAAEFLSILPEGQATPGHDFRSVTNEDGVVIGALWFAPDRGPGRSTIFIWDIEIDLAFRGHGYGRATLAALEPIARELGFSGIGLHVFGDNEVARNLYRSAGYAETDVSMVKRLL